MLSLVRTFGAFVAVTVTSLRKALSVVISFVIFRYVSKVGILKLNIYLYGSAKISAVLSTCFFCLCASAAIKHMTKLQYFILKIWPFWELHNNWTGIELKVRWYQKEILVSSKFNSRNKWTNFLKDFCPSIYRGSNHKSNGKILCWLMIIYYLVYNKVPLLLVWPILEARAEILQKIWVTCSEIWRYQKDQIIFPLVWGT